MARVRHASIGVHLELLLLFVILWAVYELHMFVVLRHEVLQHDAWFITKVALPPVLLYSLAASGHWIGIIFFLAMVAPLLASWLAASQWPGSRSLRVLARTVIVAWWLCIDFAAAMGV